MKSGVDPKYCPYYDILDELLGDRQFSSMQGVDTSYHESQVSHLKEQENIKNLDIASGDAKDKEDDDFVLYEFSDDGILSEYLVPALEEGVPSTSKEEGVPSTSKEEEDNQNPHLGYWKK